MTLGARLPLGRRWFDSWSPEYRLPLGLEPLTRYFPNGIPCVAVA